MHAILPNMLINIYCLNVKHLKNTFAFWTQQTKISWTQLVGYNKRTELTNYEIKLHQSVGRLVYLIKEYIA